ncbi:Uncharacterised protein [Candidatus Bilamarchaeum dharawalense]|uniref:GTP-dependent dephospho-CoA kinase n=1 Tax=Candidatus Bilamarchaeum dharawalense TaxID=2885759 RepID=A0A5E4LQ42_9ARCH|nr:Uncharacterised protein [Candidatus Bilamarchaeum dharawalense]
MNIPDEIKNELKKPLGRLVQIQEMKEISLSKKIISVGDVCTLNLISIGITPHLAVFDHIYMRKNLDPESVRILHTKFSKPKKYKNPPGTLSNRIINDAKKLIENGGAVLIDGEEDLTALAFILAANENYVVVYGQPNEGMILVEPEKGIKKKIEKLISAAALGHEIKSDESEN